MFYKKQNRLFTFYIKTKQQKLNYHYIAHSNFLSFYLFSFMFQFPMNCGLGLGYIPKSAVLKTVVMGVSSKHKALKIKSNLEFVEHVAV